MSQNETVYQDETPPFGTVFAGVRLGTGFAGRDIRFNWHAKTFWIRLSLLSEKGRMIVKGTQNNGKQKSTRMARIAGYQAVA
jgi:hypothetical protein